MVHRDTWIEYISDNSPLYALTMRGVRSLPMAWHTGEVKACESYTVQFSKLFLTSLNCPG